MQKKHLKLLSLTLCAAMCGSLAACSSGGGDDSGSSEGSSGGNTLEVAYNLTTEDFSVFEQIIQDFTEETGVEVTITTAVMIMNLL